MKYNSTNTINTNRVVLYFPEKGEWRTACVLIVIDGEKLRGQHGVIFCKYPHARFMKGGMLMLLNSTLNSAEFQTSSASPVPAA